MIASARASAVKRLEDAGVREKLLHMQHDPQLVIQATSFSSDTVHYPDGQIPFVEKHMAYLMQYPKLDPDQYLANLRLKLKKK